MAESFSGTCPFFGVVQTSCFLQFVSRWRWCLHRILKRCAARPDTSRFL